jgi:hypothetical protein
MNGDLIIQLEISLEQELLEVTTSIFVLLQKMGKLTITLTTVA